MTQREADDFFTAVAAAMAAHTTLSEQPGVFSELTSRSIHPEADASTGNQAVMVRPPTTQSAIFQASVSFEAGDPESVSRFVRRYAIRGLAGN